jgi:hypothetical protein
MRTAACGDLQHFEMWPGHDRIADLVCISNGRFEMEPRLNRSVPVPSTGRILPEFLESPLDAEWYAQELNTAFRRVGTLMCGVESFRLAPMLCTLFAQYSIVPVITRHRAAPCQSQRRPARSALETSSRMPAEQKTYSQIIAVSV